MKYPTHANRCNQNGTHIMPRSSPFNHHHFSGDIILRAALALALFAFLPRCCRSSGRARIDLLHVDETCIRVGRNGAAWDRCKWSVG